MRGAAVANGRSSCQPARTPRRCQAATAMPASTTRSAMAIRLADSNQGPVVDGVATSISSGKSRTRHPRPRRTERSRMATSPHDLKPPCPGLTGCSHRFDILTFIKFKTSFRQDKPFFRLNQNFSRFFFARWVDEASEHSAPLSGQFRAAELGQAGFELGPGQHGQARIILQDGDKHLVLISRQDGDRPVGRVVPERLVRARVDAGRSRRPRLRPGHRPRTVRGTCRGHAASAAHRCDHAGQPGPSWCRHP